ncbi:MAG: FAD-binding oxidoreductase [Nitrososphaeria archaeon]|nr:FAD-binding oxidoreductase [Conexivisphaerales archaeon]
MSVTNELAKIVGKEYVLTKYEDIVPYVKDASYIEGKKPIAVVIPGSTSEVSKILKLCYDNNIPVYVRGGGTSLTGSSVPEGGIVMSMLRFDKILEVNIKDRYVIAEAGVRVGELNAYLERYGYMYPPDPASDIAATVGGSINTNAGGVRGAKYGATKEWVLGLEVVLPDGTVTQFGEKTLKRSEGYDLTALMVGSEGTLAVITKAILKIAPLPKRDTMFLVFYDSYKKFGDVIGTLNERGLIPLTAEFLDEISMDAVKGYGIPYPDKAKALLIIITSENSDETLKALKETDPIEVRTIKDQAEMDNAMKLRKGLYSSLLLERDKPEQKVIIGDIVVPPSKISETIDEIYRAIQSSGMKVSIFGHIGDGNVHLNIFTGPNEIDKAKELLLETAMIAVKHGGCVSAEHGIGLEKKELLQKEFAYRGNQINLELMKKIKNVFDPRDILNRGKLIE